MADHVGFVTADADGASCHDEPGCPRSFSRRNPLLLLRRRFRMFRA